MEFDIVDNLIKSKSWSEKEIHSILQMDDETVLYFFDEFPIERFSNNVSIKKKIFKKMEELYNRYMYTRLGNIETIFDALIILFPKKYFKLVGVQNINKFPYLFQITLLDYCLITYNKMVKKDVLEFIKINPKLNNLYSDLTKLLIQYKFSNKISVLKTIINMSAINKTDTYFVERINNLQKEVKIFSKDDFLLIKEKLK